MIMISALEFGPMLFRGRILLEGINEMTGQGDKIVQAAVDGKPIHSYVAEDRFER